jgi:hypothetical protein
LSDSNNNSDPIDANNNNNDPRGQSEPQNSGNIDKDKKDEERSSPEQNEQSTPERWILVLAIAILAFGVILLTLRSVVFSLMLVTIGISLFAYWLYLGVRSREQARSLPNYVSNSTFRKLEGSERKLVCTCSICKHSESKSCMQKRCPCCILTRNKEIVGHFSNPLH